MRTRLDISTKMKDLAMFINFLVPSTTSSGVVPVFLDGTTAAASGVPSSDDMVVFVSEVMIFGTRLVLLCCQCLEQVSLLGVGVSNA